MMPLFFSYIRESNFKQTCMKKIAVSFALLVLVVASGFTISMLWSVKSEAASVSFELPDEGTKGTLSGLKASIEFDQKDPASSKIKASMDVKTLNTGNKQKDDHLMSADFFNAEKYPQITFQSTSVKAAEKGFLANGNLTIKDSTKAVEIPFTFTESATGEGSFNGTMIVFAGDYGVTKKGKSGKDKVEITISVPVTK
ncbi:MAG: YceI family protein [Bacteroidota bacterium]|jgi:polyisoprenoid-binding protein YceI|nr:YceI family protein [Bacteroidota bacterium]